MSEHAKCVQKGVHEIAEVLMRERPGISMVDVWKEALTLYWVRFDMEVPLPRNQAEARRFEVRMRRPAVRQARRREAERREP